MLEKLAMVHHRGLDSLRLAQAEGVPTVFGTDLLGHMHPQQNNEFLLRAAVLSPVQILQSATIEAARLMRLEGQVGELKAGAWADLLIVDGDPTVDAGVMANPAKSIALGMQAGRIFLNRMPA